MALSTVTSAILTALSTEVGSQISLTSDNLIAVGIAVAQEVIKQVEIEISSRIPSVITVLHDLSSFNGQLTVEEKKDLDNLIEKFMPQVLSAMTQIEQGCIVLCEDVTDVAESWWNKCFKSTKATSPPTPTPASTLIAIADAHANPIVVPPLALTRQLTGLTDIIKSSPSHKVKIQALHTLLNKTS